MINAWKVVLFSWVTPRNKSWENKFKFLVIYIAEGKKNANKGCIVREPQSYWGTLMGTWTFSCLTRGNQQTYLPTTISHRLKSLLEGINCPLEIQWKNRINHQVTGCVWNWKFLGWYVGIQSEPRVYGKVTESVYSSY